MEEILAATRGFDDHGKLRRQEGAENAQGLLWEKNNAWARWDAVQIHRKTSRSISPEDAPKGRVAFVFTDIQDSTQLFQDSPDDMMQALIGHNGILLATLDSCRGFVVKSEGDSFMVVFSSASDAIEWSVYAQHALLDHPWAEDFLKHGSASVEVDETGEPLFAGPRVRMGIHVGTPMCYPNPVNGRPDYYGPVVNAAARISSSAHGGQIVCSQAVMDAYYYSIQTETRERPLLQELIQQDLGEHSFKGVDEKIRIYQLSSPRLRNRKFPEFPRDQQPLCPQCKGQLRCAECTE